MKAALFLLLFFVCRSSGRIGETQGEIEKRFGDPKSISKANQWGVTQLRFKQGADWILVSLMDGTICDILYSGLSGSEAVEMLRRQKEGAKWVKSEGTGMTRWDCVELNWVSFYTHQNGSLAISDNRTTKKLNERQRDTDNPRLKGF